VLSHLLCDKAAVQETGACRRPLEREILMRPNRSTSPTCRGGEAQRAPSARLGIADTFRKCAQTISAAPAKSAIFSGDFETCGGSKNRRLRQCKISISEVLISVTLSGRGEVAERLKAAVC
jgi:hypothetical protein